MGIMSFESMMGSVVVTVDVTAGDLFGAMCDRKNHLVRMVYNLAVRKAEDHIVLFPQLSGGVEIKIHNLGGKHILPDGAYVPFDPEVIYVEAEVVADFQSDHSKSAMAELNVLHAGDYMFLACLLNPGDGPKAYLLAGSYVQFFDQLREIESASRALSSDDKAIPIPVPTPVSAEAVPSPAPTEQFETVSTQAPPLVPSYDYGEPNLKNPTSGPTSVPEDNGMLSMDEINAIINGTGETAVQEDSAEVMQNDDVDEAGQNDDLVLDVTEVESEETVEEEGGLYIS